MPEYLIAIAIGPVQDFISAGRRTRDLWFGSKLLSDVSRTAAASVSDNKGLLIFPGPRALHQAEGGIANVILAELPPGAPTPKAVTEQARTDCEKFWKSQARAARDRAGDLVETGRWQDQWEAEVIEFYAAWCLLDRADYAGSRRRVMRLLAARKSIRDFQPWQGQAGVPKSSLDGARETVLKAIGDQKDEIPKTKARQLRLARGEQLDIVGLTKRLKEVQGFPSVTRIAADTWVRGLTEVAAKPLLLLCESLANNGLLIRLDRSRDPVFPYEGTAVYKTRHHELAEETGDKQSYLPLTRCIESLEREFGVPDPYVAVIAADGDRMGQAISKKTRPEDHRRFSDELAAFAKAVREIVDANHGSLIYSGGDDVLAVLPVSRAIQCAWQLRNRFQELVVPEAEGASLSVGVAVAHSMEHMEDLLQYARAAEKHAKEGDPGQPANEKRNALAVHVHPRGGGAVKVRRRWDAATWPLRLKHWTDAYIDGALSNKAAYDMGRLLSTYRISDTRRWPGDLFAQAFAPDAALLLKRKESSEQAKARLQSLFSGISTWAEAQTAVSELLVARRLAAAVRQPRKLKGAHHGLPLED